MTQFQRVTIYADDDETVLTELSTDPEHEHPWLKVIDKLGEAAIDFVAGSATIGQLSFKAIDKRTIADDQDSGYLTALIAANQGLLGNRVLVEQQRVGSGTYYKVFNGVITDHPLADTLVTYNFALRDNHERVRSSRLFTKLRGMTILPMGVENGYGYSEASGTYLIPPTPPLRGVFWRDPRKPTLAGRVKLDLTIDQARIEAPTYRMMQSRFGAPREMFDETTGRSLGIFYPNIGIKWRAYPGGGAWTEWDGATMPMVKDTDYSMANIFALAEGLFTLADLPGDLFGGQNINWLVNMTKPAGGVLPAHQQVIEIIVLANGEPSEDLPQFIDENFGTLLDKVTSGYYDKYPMGVTLNAAALAAMVTQTKRARTIITAVVDGDGAPKKWIESEIYKPNGYAPQLNDDGEIVPLKWELPNVDEVLLEISDDVVRADAKWSLTDADAVNVISFDTYNEFLIPPRRSSDLAFNRLRIQKQTDVDATIVTMAKLGLKEVAYKQMTVRNIINSAGLVNDTNLGARLRAERRAQVRDRFGRGAQRITAYCRRSATGISEAQEGQWCQVSISWLPEFGTGRRGTNRLMQIVKIKEDDQAFRGFELLDAGPFGAPTAQPTIGVVTVDGDGYITIPVDDIPVGGFARVDFAASAAEPPIDSGLWLYASRRDTPGDIVIGPFESNSTVWYRARGEKEGTRRSAWTNPDNIVVAYIIRAYDVRVVISLLGVVTVFFKTTNGTDSARIYYDVHDRDPDWLGAYGAFLDVDPALGETGVELPVIVTTGQDVGVQVRPSRLGVDGFDSERVLEQEFFSSSSAPVLELLVVDGDTQNIYISPVATTAEGIGVTIYYAFGDEPFISTVANGGVIAVPRATNNSGDHHLRVKAVADNGFVDVKELTIDFDVSPEIAITAEMVPIFSAGVQIGWRIRGTADDDTRAVTIAVSGDLALQASTSSTNTMSGAVMWIDTTSTKTWWVDFTQSPGQNGTATLTPREFSDPANGGLGGQPALISLSRASVTTHSIRDLSASEKEITISVNPPTATIAYRVDGGIWTQATGGSVTFTKNVQAADVVFEYYSFTASGTVEEIKRHVIDEDHQPEITSLNVVELVSSPNTVRVSAGLDDDVVRWAIWARPGAYPTATGTLASTDTEQPLEKYKKYDGGFESSDVDFRALAATWYGMVRAYDYIGNYVQREFSVVVSGVPDVIGTLSNVRVVATTEGGLDYNDVLWDHDAEVQSNNHTVTIRENGVQVEVGQDARLEHDGSSVVALVGGWHTQRNRAAPGAAGAELLTWSYAIDLIRVSDSELLGTYSASITDWYTVGGGGGGPTAPATIPTALIATGGIGYADAAWTNPDAISSIRIEWEKFVGGVWTAYTSANLGAGVATFTQTGLTAGDQMRFKVIYYNGIGDSSAGYATSASTTVLTPGSPPSEIPSTVVPNGAAGAQGRGRWTNTSSAYDIECEFWVDRSDGFGFVADSSWFAVAGDTTTPYFTWDFGDRLKVRARYHNSVGNGAWSALSASILLH